MKSKTKLIKILLEVGLKQAEAEIYIAGLSAGPTTILELSRLTSIKRSTVYSLIESMKQKGLCYEQLDGWKKYFAMSEPETLKEMINRKKENLELLIPEFNRLLITKNENESIEHWKGLDGIKTIYTEILNSIDHNWYEYIVGNIQTWYELDPNFFNNHIIKRAIITKKYKSTVRAIFSPSSFSIYNHKNQSNLNMEIKLTDLSQDMSNILITPNFVMIQQLTPPIQGIVLRNSGSISAHKQMFDLLWNSL